MISLDFPRLSLELHLVVFGFARSSSENHMCSAGFLMFSSLGEGFCDCRLQTQNLRNNLV